MQQAVARRVLPLVDCCNDVREQASFFQLPSLRIRSHTSFSIRI